MGHRGSAATHPENTLPSFAEALRVGATHLELDVHATRDGAIVVLHDDVLDRTTDGTGPVGALDLADLRRLDASARFAPLAGFAAGTFDRPLSVPTLAEVLEAFPDAPLNVDVKDHRLEVADRVLDVLRAHGALDRTLLASEDAATLAHVRARAGDEVATGLAAAEVFGFLGSLGDRTWKPPGKALQIPAVFGELVLVTAESVAFAHAVGLEVHVWTVDEPDEMRRLAALGVDGVITNAPDLAVRTLRC